MNDHQFKEIITGFDAFVAGYIASSPEDQRNYDLKIVHTARVRKISERLAASLGLIYSERLLAATIAVVHDIGRFPQYCKYGTFNDSASVNHAVLSHQILKKWRVFDQLDESSRRIIFQAVSLHNVYTLPENLDPYSSQFIKLIRDADKLDIWRVLIEYFSVAPKDRAAAVVWDLPDTGACSASALHEIIAGRMINRSRLQTVDDFKLLQLSWVYDLNFNESLVLLHELGYVETLVNLLPDQPGSVEAADTVRDYINSRISNSDSFLVRW